MAGIIEILEEFNLELDDEIALISDFSDNLAVYISVIDGKHEVLLEESVILLDEVCFFEKRIGNFLKNSIKFHREVKKVAKKLSATPRDKALLIDRVKKVIKQIQILNQEKEILIVKTRELANKYLLLNK